MGSFLYFKAHVVKSSLYPAGSSFRSSAVEIASSEYVSTIHTEIDILLDTLP